MASICFNNIAVAEQLCYIPCNFCNIVLMVRVPCSKLFDIVKVRCEHCTNLWPVNMGMVHHFHPNSTSQNSSSSPLLHNQLVLKNSSSNSRVDSGSSSRYIPMKLPSSSIIKDQNPTNIPTPTKRKRVPSAYNQFIKQEIQRVKANNPDISHREAFSAAAKNWARFPHIHLLEANNHQDELDESCGEGSNKQLKLIAESFNI